MWPLSAEAGARNVPELRRAYQAAGQHDLGGFMDSAISTLLGRYESRKISRRAFVQGMAALAATAAGPAPQRRPTSRWTVSITSPFWSAIYRNRPTSTNACWVLRWKNAAWK